MKWWEKNNFRLIQNNLRETDASADAAHIVDQAEVFGANALMLNTGGVVAFYPTELKYHYKSPWLKGDFIGDAVKKCHERGMKFFARFDMSKAHESIYPNKPSWFYVSPQGKTINYNGMIHTCILGEYQQEYSLKIIAEVLDRYPIDGMYFNMFGFVTKDYSNTYHGICQCDSCREKFFEMYGLPLPKIEDAADPVFQKYLEFKRIIVNNTWKNIRTLLDSKGFEDMPISTSTANPYIDIVRPESNTEIHRPYPLWQYSASENCQSIETTWDDKIVSNISINAIGLDYRFTGVPTADTKVRFYQNIAAGSGLDFCVIGMFDDYPDRENFKVVKEIFNFHKTNEQYLGRLRAKADVMLVKPNALTDEYLGIFKMLKEEHIQFEATHLSNLASRINRGHGYKTVILPNVPDLDEEQREVLRGAADRGMSIVATDRSLIGSKENAAFLSELFGAKRVQKTWDARWAYIDVSENREIYKSYPERDWLFIDGNFAQVNYGDGVELSARFISAGRFGPPEKCGGNEKTDRFAVAIKKNGKGSFVHMPWQVGWMYQKYGYECHKRLFVDVLDHIVDSKWKVKTNAPINVEISTGKLENDGSGRTENILHVLNLSGYNGMTFFPPNDIHDIKITLTGLGRQTKARSLVSGKDVPFTMDGDDVVFEIEKLGIFESIVME
ncbi:MAG: family 10 glycosylhydrolase [Clostridiales bacterium]|nr:family 10 glycosylhydrolase [Clostridiales bacterium]